MRPETWDDLVNGVFRDWAKNIKGRHEIKVSEYKKKKLLKEKKEVEEDKRQPKLF